MNRREFIAASLGLLALPRFAFSTSARPQVAITMDDFNWEAGCTKLTPDRRNDAILSALQKAQLKAALFVCGKFLEKEHGRALLQKWDSAGHWIGNHTYSHPYYPEITAEAFCADIQKNEQSLSHYKNFQKIFRFPYLKEGESAAKRDAVRAFLSQNHYRNGYVTIDASDWYVHNRLQQKLAMNPKTNTAPYRDFYLKHLFGRATYYNDLASQVLKRNVRHTILIHHNELNGLFLADVIEMFRKNNWDVINADDAFGDPLFREEPNIVPAGESIIWALAKATHQFDKVLRYPGEDGDYEKPEMDRLGL